MNETELERMIVRLVGDGSSYQQMMQQAVASSQQTARAVELAGARIEGMKNALQGFGSAAVGLLGGFGLATSLGYAFEKFAEKEKGMLQLTAAIESNGRAAEPVIADYYEFAKAVEASTLQTKGSVMHLLKQAETFGLSGDAAKRAAQSAIGLAAVAEGDAESLMRVGVALETNNMRMLRFAGRMVPALRMARTDAELLAKAQQLVASGTRIAAAEAESTSGQIQKLKRSFADLTKEIGGMVASALNPLLTALRKAIDWYKELDKPTKEAIAAVATLALVITNFGTILKWVTPLWTLFKTGGGIGVLPLAAIAAIVQAMGGLGEAWKKVKAAAIAAWEWTAPIRAELLELWHTVVDVATEAFNSVKEVALAVFAAILGNAEISWGDVRDAITQAIRAIRDFIREHGDFVKGVFLAIAVLGTYRLVVGAVSFAFSTLVPLIRMAWNLLTGGIWGIIIGGVVAVVSHFVGWQNIIDYVVVAFQEMKLMWDITVTAIALGLSKLKDEFESFLARIRPTMSAIVLSTRYVATGTGREEAAEAIGAIGRAGVVSDTTRALEGELTALTGRFDSALEAYRSRRRALTPAPSEIRDHAEAWAGMTEPIREMRHELEKLTGTAYGSAEALHRIAAYRDAYYSSGAAAAATTAATAAATAARTPRSGSIRISSEAWSDVAPEGGGAVAPALERVGDAVRSVPAAFAEWISRAASIPVRVVGGGGPAV